MKITFFSNMTTKEQSLKRLPLLEKHSVSFFRLDESDKLMQNVPDTEILIADAMGKVDEKMICSLPELKLIQSEGVGYQGIDVTFAAKRGIAVCNNKGVNDTAVAEDTVLLILACLKSLVTGNQSIYDGHQIEVKKAAFGKMRELSECTVGLIGFGDIAKATAEYLNAFGANVIYTNRTRYPDLEKEYNVSFCDMDTLLKKSDFVSLHVAVTQDTIKMVNADFLGKMKSSAFLINTSRGDLVDNAALYDALLNGRLAGAGLDVISPEPVTADNILLDEKIRDKMILTPHIAGITSLTVDKIYRNIQENISRYSNGEDLKNRVN